MPIEFYFGIQYITFDWKITITFHSHRTLSNCKYMTSLPQCLPHFRSILCVAISCHLSSFDNYVRWRHVRLAVHVAHGCCCWPDFLATPPTLKMQWPVSWLHSSGWHTDDRAMVWDHLKWVIGPPQWGIWLGRVAVLLTDFLYCMSWLWHPAAFRLTSINQCLSFTFCEYSFLTVISSSWQCC